MTSGNSAILHGRTVDDCCLIGMGAIALDDVHMCRNSIVAAGAMVLEGFNVREGMLVARVPAKIKRFLTEEEKQFLHRSDANDIHYRDSY